MKFRKLLAISVFYFAIPSISSANPVSFKDGWGIMPTYTPNWSDHQVNYSFTSRYSLGGSVYYRKGEDDTSTFILPQFNYLIRRWNELDSQANIYVSIGAGARSDDNEKWSPAGYGSVEADYETRRVYTLAAAERLQSDNGVNFSRFRYRAGIAPYKAPIDELHTWIIIQTDYMPEMDDKLTITPLLRFFYNNFALEAGVSLNGDPFLGVMSHF